MVAGIEQVVDTIGSDTSPGSIDVVTALRWTSSDTSIIDTDNPVVRPTSGTNYSFWKNFYIRCVATAPDNAINNLKFYTDGNVYGTDIDLFIATNPVVKNSSSNAGYVVATGTIGTTGVEMVVNNSQVSSTAVVTDFLVGTPLSIGITETDNEITAIGETSNYLVFQLNVGTGASSGNIGSETLFLQYDET